MVVPFAQRRQDFFEFLPLSSSFRSFFFSCLPSLDGSHLEVVKSSSGDPIPLFFKKKFLHSRYEPRKEAERKYAHLVNSRGRHIAVMQFDFLYGLEYWVKEKSLHYRQQKSQTKPDYFLLLVVDDWALFDAFILHRHWDFLDFFSHIDLWHPKNQCRNDFLQLSFMRWSPKSFRGITFFERGDWHGNESDDFSLQVKNNLLACISDYFSQHFTEYVFEKKWLINSFINLIHQKNVRLIDDFFSKVNVKEKDFAVVVASGPSLDEQIGELSLLQEKTTIIAVDSAVPILLSRQIQPDIVVAVDAGYYNALDLSFDDFFAEKKVKKRKKKTFLLSSFFIHPLFLRYSKQKNYANPYFFYLRREDVLCRNFFLNEEFSSQNAESANQSMVNKSSSVFLVAIDIARKMGFGNVVAYGMDGCYPFLHGHASMSMHDRYFSGRSFRLRPREQADFFSVARQMEKIPTKPQNDDNFFLYDTPSLRMFRQELARYFSISAHKMMKLFVRSPYFFAVQDEGETAAAEMFFRPLKNFQELKNLLTKSHRPPLFLKSDETFSEIFSPKNSDFFREKSQNFFALVDVFERQVKNYHFADDETKKKVEQELQSLIKNDLAFLHSSMQNHENILSMGKNNVPQKNTHRKELIYYDALRLLWRLKSYFSSILR